MDARDDDRGPVAPGLVDVGSVRAVPRTVGGPLGRAIECRTRKNDVRAVAAEGDEVFNPVGRQAPLQYRSKNASTPAAEPSRPSNAANRISE